MLDSVSGESIKEIWRITPYMFTNSYQHIIIFKDGTHLCTCLLLVSHGIICRHYFKLMVENSNALFHVLLMPTRWLQDDVWDRVDEIFNEPFIGSSSKNSKQPQDHSTVQQQPDFNPVHYNNIQEVQVRRCIQKKIDYGRLLGHFKKAINYSLEDNDQQNLDDIILSYISERQAKRQTVTVRTARSSEQLEETRNILEDSRKSNNEITLSDGRVYDINDINDPIKYNCKGRPPIKRMKGYNESNHTVSTSKSQKENVQNHGDMNGRKCGICHKTGHYAPRCPDRE